MRAFLAKAATILLLPPHVLLVLILQIVTLVAKLQIFAFPAIMDII